MPWFDQPLDQLRDYRTNTVEPPELDRWWQLRLEAARAAARPPVLLARRITARCLLSVGLMDTICPPSTVFAAYNEITAGKDISVHPFTGHAVPATHVERQLRHLRDFLS